MPGVCSNSFNVVSEKCRHPGQRLSMNMVTLTFSLSSTAAACSASFVPTCRYFSWVVRAALTLCSTVFMPSELTAWTSPRAAASRTAGCTRRSAAPASNLAI